VQFDVSGTGTAEYLISLRQDTCLASKARQPNSGVGEDVILDPLALSGLIQLDLAFPARHRLGGKSKCVRFVQLLVFFLNSDAVVWCLKQNF
jgi:hypothetical protein